MQPAFPMRIYYTDEQGHVDDVQVVEEELDLFSEIEFFTSGEDGYVLDAEGRRVRLTLTPWKVTYEAE